MNAFTKTKLVLCLRHKIINRSLIICLAFCFVYKTFINPNVMMQCNLSCEYRINYVYLFVCCLNELKQTVLAYFVFVKLKLLLYFDYYCFYCTRSFSKNIHFFHLYANNTLLLKIFRGKRFSSYLLNVYYSVVRVFTRCSSCYREMTEARNREFCRWRGTDQATAARLCFTNWLKPHQ